MVSTGQELPDYCNEQLPLDTAQLTCQVTRMIDVKSESGLMGSCSSPLRLDDLQPDVLFHVLLFLDNQDVARLKQASSRLRLHALQACEHWAPKVESWLLAEPNSACLLRRLRALDPQPLAQGQQQLCSAASPNSNLQDGTSAALPSAVSTYCNEQHEVEAGMQPHTLQQHQVLLPADMAAADHHCSLNSSAEKQPYASKLLKRLDWRQVWSCIQRAQQGPWQLDVQALAPAVSPNGVLLTFELLLQQPAPAPEHEQQTIGWKDSVTIMSFVLDKKVVDIVVDASGRVTSPQRDWCQGCIQLQPDQPRLLALEVSYIFPVPAWFLHPCTLAAPRFSPSSNASCGTCSCASSLSGMPLDQTWDSYSTATSGSSMSISQSAALCSAAPCGRTDSYSLASSSLTSSGSLGNCTIASSNSCQTCGNAGGRPRLSLDLSTGFGSYVMDPRYIDEASPNLLHRGLDRMELSARVCWRPSKVQSWLGRLLPGIRGHSSSNSSSATGNSSSSNSSSNAGSASPRSSITGGTAAACSPGCSGKQGSKPSFAVTLSKAAAWQVPSDTDRRFAEGFMFWAVNHKLEVLLEQYGVLQHGHSTAVGATAVQQGEQTDAAAGPAVIS